MTIKAGSIKNVADPTVGIQLMEDYSATWDGATWVDREIVYTDYAGKLTTIGNETTGNASQLYLKGDVGLDSYKVGGNDVWTVKLYAAGGEENGLFLNGVKLTSASLLKYNDRDNFWFAEGFTAAVGDTLTIKGAFRNDTQEAQVTLEESVFVWDGSAWKDQKDDVETDYTAMNLERVALSGTGERWVFWLEPSVPLPAGGRYEDFAVYINDTLITPESLETMNEDGRLLLVVWGPLTNGVLPKEGDKVTIKAGKVQNIENPSVGIALENDFVITWDGASWLLPNQQVRYQEVSFSGINENGTRFVDGDFPAWHMYLTPDDRLPGVPDSLGAPGTYFSGLKLSVNGRETDVVIYHASFENTAFMVIPAELLPENITTDTRVILKAGKAGSSDGSDGIWLKQDLVIYANRYGMSLEGFLKPAEIIQENARLELDRGTAYGGNENGIYLNTNDKFPVDTTWATNIRAVTYDANSGVFLNGQKVNAVLKRYGDGKLYVGLADAGLAAKDKDQVTIRGMFALNGVSVSYAEVSFYYNGKTWGTTYTEAPPETYTQFKAESVNMVTAYDSQNRRWNVYLNINNILPGDIDKISFEGLSVEIGGKLYPVYTAHSYQHTLYLFIDDSILPADSKNGTKVTLKAGKALAADRSTGIQLLEDFSFYTFMGTMSERIPTDETTWQEASVLRMNQTACFNKESRTWPFHLKLSRVPEGIETGTYYYQFPIEVDGKTHRVNVMLDGEFLFFNVPESVLPENAGTAVISIAAGAEALANAGYDGIRITEDWKAYLYNGEISERKFEGMETVEANIVGLQNASEDVQMYHLYLRLNKEIPGTEWYEQYRDFVYEYNGQTIMATAVKAGSSDGKTLYIPVEFSKIGRKAQEGDLITIRPNTVGTCGGYQFTILNEFTMMYSDGLWTRYVETDVEAPEDIGSLWSIARFDPGYIPTTTDGSVLFSNEDKYNVITSTEDLKDFTIRFKVKKFYDDELVPPIALVLRGKPISEDEEMSRTLLYGYGITFSALEVQNDSENPEAGSTWTQYIELWKNGENGSLLDQYRISYVYDKTDHPFFQYDEEYEYEISIYNITETCVCILVKVNDKLVMRYYDEAGSDVLDPAVNGGKFAVYAACPTYITDDVVELDAVIAAREECEIGDEVRIAATYPSVLEGAEFSVDEDGATVSDGVFVATKAGTYTVSGAYNGKQLTPVQITVAEKQEENIVTEQEETEDGFPWIFVGAAGGAVVIAAVVVSVVLSVKHKKKKQQAKES